jgi:hypothetical protein
LVIVIVWAPVGPEAVTLIESITPPVPSISYSEKDNGETAGKNVNVNINDWVEGLLKVGAERRAQKEVQVVPAPDCGVAIRFAGEPEARPAVYPVMFKDTLAAGFPIELKVPLREPAVYGTVFQSRSWAFDLNIIIQQTKVIITVLINYRILIFKITTVYKEIVSINTKSTYYVIIA